MRVRTAACSTTSPTACVTYAATRYSPRSSPRRCSTPPWPWAIIHMLPVFAKDVLQVDSRGLGILASAAGIGALTGLLSYAWLQLRMSPRNLMVGALTVYNVALIGLAFSDWYWLSFCMILVAGLCHGYFLTCVQVMLQTLVEDHYRGRVMSVFALVWSLMFLSGFLLNIAGALVGPRLALAGGAAIVLAYVWLSLVRATALRKSGPGAQAKLTSPITHHAVQHTEEPPNADHRFARSTATRRTRRNAPGTTSRTGRPPPRATRWWRRWTSSASTARSSSPPSPCTSYDASYAVEVQRKHPDRFAIVKPVNPDDPAVADVIAEWKKQPGAVGIRIMLTKDPGRDRAFDHPGLDRIAARSRQARLPGQRPVLGQRGRGHEADRPPPRHAVHHRPPRHPAAAHAACAAASPGPTCRRCWTSPSARTR